MPAQAGIQLCDMTFLDSRLRGNDKFEIKKIHLSTNDFCMRLFFPYSPTSGFYISLFLDLLNRPTKIISPVGIILIPVKACTTGRK